VREVDSGRQALVELLGGQLEVDAATHHFGPGEPGVVVSDLLQRGPHFVAGPNEVGIEAGLSTS
jgi:hypothetical protein